MKQTRTKISNLELTEKDEEYILEGYFSKFNDETELFDGVFERVSPEAFEGFENRDIRALVDHDPCKILGRTKNGTLKLEVDDVGLYGEVKINKRDSEAVNVYERIKRGDINQCSFGFQIRDEEFEERSDKSVLFTLKEVDLFEVSVVTFPAYENTEINARKKQVKEIDKRKLMLKKQELKERLKKC